MLPTLLKILLLTSISTNCQVSEDQIDYYENLILTNQRNALEYQFPKSAASYTNTNRRTENYGTFDYIVIGSGTAGSVIASRLSEISKIRVLVLEAGDFENDFVDIPGMAFYAQGSNYNWGFFSQPQTEGCLGMVDKKCPHQRGRGFGGTSLINGLVYSRCGKTDYDLWGAENPGWDYNTVLKYFKKSENTTITNGDPGYHSTTGPYHVEYSTFDSPHLDAYLKANVELGRKIIDYNGKEILGVSPAQFYTRNGRRESSARAFLYPNLNRTNLYLSGNSYVTKIGFTGKRATHVYFTKNNTLYMACARKEIIVSAGAIMSPHILMLSGIGPKNHLNQIGIKNIVDLEVGSNFQEHPCFFGLNVLSNVSIPIKPLRGYIKDYFEGTGIYTLPGNNAGVGFFKSNQNTSHAADIEIMLISANRSDAYFQKGFSFNDESYHAITDGIANNNPTTFTMYIDVLHPDSKGTVRLASKNPFDYPIINPKYFEGSNNTDVDTIYYGIQLIQEMLETDAFKKINASLGRVILPACASFKYGSEDFWKCTIKHLSSSLYHPVGTCKMGPNPKTGAVVDNKLRVYGVQNLRVADGSVIPFSLAGHPNAPIAMVGERLADFIKETL